MRVRLQVAYDGRGFRGFAPQVPGVRTVGGVLAGALERILRLDHPPSLTCAGRTDAGVHAWDQWAHVDVPASAMGECDDIRRRLIKLLGPEVVVRSVSIAPDGWDARRSAISRTYRYTVLTSPAPNPFLAGFVWWVPHSLDLRGMQLACDAIIGEHDFSSFCRAGPIPPNRRVRDAGWSAPEPDIARFEITADGFCQQMVRSLVGTFVEVGRGKLKAGDVGAIVRARDRATAPPVAPPDGLVLHHVRYD